ncbi:LacI family DNA-binding transcriptional regulator [Tissierella sp. Yu-01]|uniref:LacI family DNA-binding transcriptional regulator n=1 Tax=Tissierella sp. Yu-01 TaxID=3035694 RepID=UPI00240E77F8|nr:LacI family DNA-binding transcriptional regulator [Tissierella sp. Yu-01]WFA10141.1 LacI family DNA-binding transcriptional regulator [Tissierella sp. Yu-01]
MGNVTMKEIARRANVSTATVSRVINNKGPISEITKSKVLAAIETLEYHPNLVARSLKNSTTHTISLVVSDISNAYFAKLSLAVEQVIHPKGYTLIVCSTGDSPEKEAGDLKNLLEKKVDGIILNTTGGNNEYISALSRKAPLVLCNRKIDNFDINCDFIDNDNYTASYKLTSNLIEQGHKKIGIVNGPMIVSSAQERFEGFKDAMNKISINITQDYEYYFDARYDEQSGYEVAKKVASLENKPTALVIMNGPMTIGALRYFRSQNIRIPEDISIVSATDIINQDLFYIELNAAIMDPWIIGKRAAEMLIERIEQDNKIPNREVRFYPEIRIGNSTKIIG